MIALGGGWKLGDDVTWVLYDESNRPVLSVVSREELYLRLRKLGIPLTDAARDQLADLPEYHPQSRQLAPSGQQPTKEVAAA